MLKKMRIMFVTKNYVLFVGLRFGSSPDPYLTKFCPVVEFPWYRMLKVSEERTWFFKIHVGIGWWRKDMCTHAPL